MKKIVFDVEQSVIPFSMINESTPIFAKKAGVLYGMVVQGHDGRWALRIGGACSDTGAYLTLRKCLGSVNSDISFYVE